MLNGLRDENPNNRLWTPPLLQAQSDQTWR